ncbi:MAG: ABC transporter ATP-binding protein [Thermoanaerobaculia bacterium]|nr:ABC transporter ATP-binding protein [Thermoanaerobaculia bacterium]
MSGALIRFDDVSKFYGEVLGVNRVDLQIGPGITALVGPNGSGKSTLMNLMTGLLEPSQGRVEIFGKAPHGAPELFDQVGYCAQFDSFPRGVTGRQFIAAYLRLHGLSQREADARALQAIERVDLLPAAGKKVAAYSKGMRQRIKLAQALAHDPQILVLDEPLNGLDPMARAELIELFRELAAAGRHVILSSHILHEVDVVADEVVLIHQGYVMAKGDIPEVREEMVDHPLEILLRCATPSLVASELFAHDHILEVRLHEDGGGLMVKTRQADSFYLLLNDLVSSGRIDLEAVAPADDDVMAVYRYLVGSEGGTL